MKVLTYVITFLTVIWLFSSVINDRVQTAYKRGYRDGSRTSYKPSDVQCASWLMQTNMKEAKTRICK